ncbi:MAG: ATPase [Bacteroidetes bacterium]|nr:MAG: ATPase [Bacteroidota bacterium]
MSGWLSKFRERVNISLFDSKELVLHVLRHISLWLMIIVIGGVVYFYGFPKTEASIQFNTILVRSSLVYFLLRFLIVIFYDFHPLRFIKERWLEGLVLLLFFIDAISPLFFDELLFFQNLKVFVKNHSLLVFQVYFLLIALWELRETAPRISKINIGPAKLLVLSFVILILGGAGLLMLPEMTVHHNLRFLDALFTATSASCVTGLTVVDTGTFFTTKGQIIILLLIQLGGINIISFAAFFAILSRKMGGLKYQSILKDLLSADQLSDTRNLLRNILKWTIYIEVMGGVLLYFSWGTIPFNSQGERIFSSVFHSISAFNNAGFSLFSDNLYQIGIQNMVAFQLVIAVLVIAGGLGFFVLQDVFGVSKIRERFRFRWKDYSVMTRISIRMTIILLTTGTVAFFFLEQNTTLVNKDLSDQILTAFFQSVSTRTAGFNTVDMSLLSTPVLMLFMLLMFIGAGSGSTGGGIKITTFAVAIKASIATIRGKNYVDFFKRTIPYSIVNRAYSIILFALAVISTSIFMLSIAEPNIDFLKLAFEEFSAFATVGLSTGITPQLSDVSKAIIISSMFIGRVGVLSIAMILSRRVVSRNYQYAKESVMVG